MSKSTEFWKPKLVGKRFDDHSIPLEILKDISVLEELISEVAKWHFLKDHTDRKRSPRGFTDGISLSLTGIEEGSAVLRIALVLLPSNTELFPPDNEEYFEKARDSIVAAIDAAEHGEQIHGHLLDNHLTYFDKIGRSLGKDESIEFAPTQNRKATLNRSTRKKLVLASRVEEITEEVTVRGTVPNIQQDKHTFDLKQIDGKVVSVPLEERYHDDVIEAVRQYRDGIRIQLKGIGSFSRSDRLVKIISVEHLNLLDQRDITSRLDEFRCLSDGWAEGAGTAPPAEFLDWIIQQFELFYPDDLEPPYLYPTADGGVQAEWSIGIRDISLEIDQATRKAQWHMLELNSGKEDSRTVNLDDAVEWRWISDTLRGNRRSK